MAEPCYLCYLLLLMFSPFLVFLLHALLIRGIRSFNTSVPPLPVAVMAVLSGYPFIGFFLWFFYFRFLNAGQAFCPVVYALIVYTCLSFCYFIFFTMTETARRIHVLRKLYEKGVPVTMDELAAEYNATDMLSVRLERMSDLKQLKHSGERYFVDNKLLYWVGIVVAVWAKVLAFSSKERK